VTGPAPFTTAVASSHLASNAALRSAGTIAFPASHSAALVAHPIAIMTIVMLLVMAIVSIVSGKSGLRNQDGAGGKRGSEHERR